MNILADLKNNLSILVFGITTEQAIAQGICIDCKEPALQKCTTELGRKEYGISGLCEPCWDRICLPKGENGEDENP